MTPAAEAQLFVLQGRSSLCTPRPSDCRGSGDVEAAVHDSGVRVADEAVTPFLQLQHEGLRAGELDTGQDPVEAWSAQVEVVNARAVADDEAVRRPSLEVRDLLALHRQSDRETGADRAVDGL